MPHAFDDITILDFTQVFAGPFATMQLALLGAEVIKIENPIGGDQTRSLLSSEPSGQPDSSTPPEPPAFKAMNVGKFALALDLKSPDAAPIVHRLVGAADVLVENFKAGTMERMGFGPEAMRALKPDLIYCSISGYGQTGPKAGAAAYDGAIQAASGMMSATGYPETGPTRTGYMPVDMMTAMNAAFAISAALNRRQRTGLGQFIDVAMLDAAILTQAAQFSTYLKTGEQAGLLGNSSPTRAPTADVFPTGDGFIQLTALRDNQVFKLCVALGLEDARNDPRFASAASRITNSEALRSLVTDALARGTTESWLRLLDAAGVPAAPIRDLAGVMAEPQLAYREILEAPTPDDDTVVKAAFLNDVDGPRMQRRAPHLGEHTRDILRRVGFSSAEIDAFFARGAVG
jgi:crotonobetainyl-CoA:carnitine CoA-transferase CaiB-like acyl-CoA transferase